MVSKLNTKCGPCGYDDTKKNAKKWCAICEEGFCEECEKSHKSMNVSRNHKMISIEDYCQIHDITVNLNCGIHGKRLDLYCKKHDTPVCIICISSEHKSCASSDVISIDEASQHAKKSIALSDLEETISKSLENAKDCINDRIMALKTMDKDEQAIRKMIKDTRMCLNTYLDELERNLLLDLTSKHVNCKFKYTKILNRLKQIEKDIVNIREQTLQMKRFKSDLKVFLGTHQLNTKILAKMGSLKEKIKDSTNNRIAIEIHPMINSLMKEVKRFEVIKVTETKAGLELKDAKVDQAQIQIHGTLQDICNISVQLQQKFDLKQPTKSITDNRIIIADYFGSGKLIEYTIDGNNIREIPASDEPYDLTAVATDRIAVTYGSFQYLEIINRNNDNERKKVPCGSYCWGISYQDQRLYVFVNGRGIVVMDLNGEKFNIIDTNLSSVYYIATTNDRIYYTDQGNNTVHCCSIHGQEIWVFKDQFISQPRGISVDYEQNVFVSCESSNNLTLIHHDGKDSKVLLTDQDELDKPGAVYYCKEKKSVCLGYKKGSVAIYQMP